MESFDVVIIGSGLGGLLCGNILSREGYRVCVLEKNKKTGGCLQVFARNKRLFNTGLNYTEGLSKGQILHKYFSYFGIMDQLRLKQMDPDGFEVITYRGKEYRHAQGEENFIETLARQFPHEREAIRAYMVKIRTVCQQFPLYNLDFEGDGQIDYEDLFSENAFDFIRSITQNETLQQVLAGNNLLYAGHPEKTPLYLHALITYSFISSAWRFVDGSQQLATAIEQIIKANGGLILRNSEVVKLEVNAGKVAYAVLADGSQIRGSTFISNIHPENTLKLTDKTHFTKAFQKRIQSLENTIGMFSLYLVLKPGVFPYLNYNHYHYTGDSVWNTAACRGSEWPCGYLLYTPATSKSDKYTESMIAIAYMDYDEVKPWEHTTVEQRGQSYIDFKQQKAEQFLDLIGKKFPGIREIVETYHCSTPLTYRDYTGTPQGSAYGIQKDYRTPFKTLITPKTKIPNLLFTGQNLNIHGILGVSIGAVMTCGELVGLPYLIQKIKKSNE